MVTSNKMPEKKIVKMAEQNNSVVVPQRTLLGEVNEHIMCPLCHGYYIDATTIVECLHSFCRSCIIKHLQVKSYCPVCEMMINSAKPNIKLDKALQDIVYKLVPGLFQKEMERRQTFYASRPGPAATATPEQRGEDTERIIFSPEDVISFSLEYADATDTDSISSKSSDSNEPQTTPTTSRRFLQCPAVVNISHLKKFLSMKFDIDSTQFAIDILYKRVPLPDYYTLMDIAYIYNWKRNEPMRFFYQIIDYIAIRNRLFDINRKGSHFRDRKSSPANTEDANVSSPAHHLNDQGPEVSSGTDSPMPDNMPKQTSDTSKKNEKTGVQSKFCIPQDSANITKHSSPLSKKSDDDVEKSQFLNSFELTAKNSALVKSPVKSSPVKSSPTKCSPTKSSPTKSSPTKSSPTHSLPTQSLPIQSLPSQSLPIQSLPTQFSPSKSSVKSNANDPVLPVTDAAPKTQITSPKVEDSLKRKHQTPPNIPEMKKLKIELEKTKLPNSLSLGTTSSTSQKEKPIDALVRLRETEHLPKISKVMPPPITVPTSSLLSTIDVKQVTNIKHHTTECPGTKRPVPGPQSISSSKRKTNNDTAAMHPPLAPPKTVSPLKLQVPKIETQSSTFKPTDLQKPMVKKIPDLKPSVPMSQLTQTKVQPVNKVRMDLLANNSDPTIDRSKILSQVKSSLSIHSTCQNSGDPLKSLFDSCKINIPSSLSITLTDQKLDPRVSGEVACTDQKKNVMNKNLAGASNTASHKAPSPPVHNYIEILKLPDTDPKKQNKSDGNSEAKPNISNKTESTTTQPKPSVKSSETSAKGPVPNLKPIDPKLGKQSGNFMSPITFQQTFEQQLQSLQTKKKSKLNKDKPQVPKLMPANPKTFNVANKLNISNSNPTQIGQPISTFENKTSTALDLSTPHNIQSQLTPHQTKAFETMQSIANLAKKQHLPLKGSMQSVSQSYSSMANRPLSMGVSQTRVPATGNVPVTKLDKLNSGGLQTNNLRQEIPNKSNQIKPTTNASPTISSQSYQMSSLHSPSMTQPSPRSQTRSPSSSPKLVIAEEKQMCSAEQNINQSNQITSTQLSNITAPKSESPKAFPGPSKQGPKLIKPVPSANKIVTGMRQPITQTLKPSPTPTEFQIISAHQELLLRRQMEMNAWLTAHSQFDIYKNLTNISHQSQNDYNKDK